MRLARLPSLDLRPLSSVRRYTDLNQDPIECGRALAANSVLDGSIQRHGERLRVSARLLDVATGRQLWADRFDEDFSDTFAIQDAIAERVADAVLKSLTGGERQQLRRHPTEDASAYQLYVMGWSALTRPGCANLESALQHLEQAVIRDPDFALAHVCIADCYAMLGAHGLRQPHNVFPKARAAVLRALEIDGNLAEAHAELGVIYTCYDFDLKRAEIALRRALEINPRCFLAHRYRGTLLMSSGKLDDALVSFRSAQALEPLAASINGNIGMVHYFAGRYEEAVAQFEATLEIDSRFDVARGFLGRSLLRLGKFERAIDQFLARTNITADRYTDLGTVYALCGKIDEAKAELERLQRRAADHYVAPIFFATIHAALKNDEAVLDWLEQGLEQRSFAFVMVDPAFHRLHDHPRFARLLQRLSLL
jgi:tetratricopeptide (TPR) repeat protein